MKPTGSHEYVEEICRYDKSHNACLTEKMVSDFFTQCGYLCIPWTYNIEQPITTDFLFCVLQMSVRRMRRKILIAFIYNSSPRAGVATLRLQLPEFC